MSDLIQKIRRLVVRLTGGDREARILRLPTRDVEGALEIRAATEEDLDRIAEIQAASPPAAHWTAPSYLTYDCRVATVAGGVAGFVVLRSVEGEHEILNLAVAPELRRQGVAIALILNVVRTCGGPVFLEVRESNRAARQLYQRLGFHPAGVRQKYYSDPEETAIVMRF